MSCWAFAADAWARPGVAALCLTLQDSHGQCPALLLWGLWTAAEARPLAAADLARAAALASDWEAAVLRPLRGVRRRLTAPFWSSDTPALPLRGRLLEAELTAERALLAALEAMSPKALEAVIDPVERLTAVAAAWRTQAPAAALAELAMAAAPEACRRHRLC